MATEIKEEWKDWQDKAKTLCPENTVFGDNPLAKELLSRMTLHFMLKHAKDEAAGICSTEVKKLEVKDGEFPNRFTPDVLFSRTRAQDAESTSTIFTPLHVLMTRAYSFMLSAVLVLENSKFKNPTEKEARLKTLKYVMEQGDYFTSLMKELENVNFLSEREWRDRNKDFDDFIESIASILPGKTHKRKLKDILRSERHVSKLIPRPIYETNSVYTSSDNKVYNVTQRATPVFSITEEQKKEWGEILKPNNPPSWFADLQPWEKEFLKKSVAAEDWKAVSLSKSCTERVTPGLAHSLKNEFIVSCEGKVVQHSTSYSFSVPSSVSNNNPADRQRHARQNIGQHLEDLGFVSVEAKRTEYSISEKIIQDFLKPFGIDASGAKFSEVKSKVPAVRCGDAEIDFSDDSEDRSIPERVLRLPLGPSSFLTPAYYEEVAPKEIVIDNNNLVMYRDKTAAFQQIFINHKNVTVNGQKVQVQAKIYDANFSVNDRRGSIRNEVIKHTLEVSLSLVKDTVNNLLVLSELHSADNKLKDYFESLNTALKEVYDISHIPKDTLEAIFKTLNTLLDHEDQTLLDAFGKDKRLDLEMLLNSLKDDIALYNDHGFGNKRNKPLFLASNHNIMQECMANLAGRHCRSSKDRRAVVDWHTEMMKLVFIAEPQTLPDGTKKRRLPQYRDDKVNRNIAVRAATRLFKPAHILESSGFNNYGSCGIKDEKTNWWGRLISGSDSQVWMIPQDILDEIVRSDTEPKDKGFFSKIGHALGLTDQTKNMLVASSYACRLNKPSPTTWHKKLTAKAIIGISFAVAAPFIVQFLGGLAALAIGFAFLGAGIGFAVARLTGRHATEYSILGAIIGFTAALVLPAVALSAAWFATCIAVGAVCGALVGLITGRSVWRSFLAGAAVGAAVSTLGFFAPAVGGIIAGVKDVVCTILTFGAGGVSCLGCALSALMLAVTGKSIFSSSKRREKLVQDIKGLDNVYDQYVKGITNRAPCHNKALDVLSNGQEHSPDKPLKVVDVVGHEYGKVFVPPPPGVSVEEVTKVVTVHHQEGGMSAVTP